VRGGLQIALEVLGEAFLHAIEQLGAHKRRHGNADPLRAIAQDRPAPLKFI
jgi:hypothetical protein